VLGNNELGLPVRRRLVVVPLVDFIVLRAIDERYNVGILFNGSGFPQVRKEGPLGSATRFYGARQLRKGNDGYVELFGYRF
jgi:hypothetical protein